MTANREKIFDKVYKDLIAMSKLAFKQLELIKNQLNGVDVANKEEEITHNELMLDGLEVKLRKRVINAIVLYTPRATDLRKIMSCYDIAMHLERIGDLVLNVHKQLSKVDLEGELYKTLYKKLLKQLTTSETMVKNSIYSFSWEDLKLTQETIALDDVVDNLFDEIHKELISQTIDKTMSEQATVEVMCINNLSYHVERIADEATNIAEAAVYLIEGRNIQHGG